MEKKESISFLWKRSIQLEGFYTFDDAPAACPAGYRLPTREEQKWLVDNSTYHFDKETEEGVFRLPNGFELRLPAAGLLYGDGDSYGQGTIGYYWSSSPSGATATHVYFDGGTARVTTSSRVDAFSVRCVPIPHINSIMDVISLSEEIINNCPALVSMPPRRLEAIVRIALLLYKEKI